MDYFEITVQQVSGEKREILVSLLADEGFESFMEEGEQLKAYIPSAGYSREKVNRVCSLLDVTCSDRLIPDQNWNAEWERQYEPVLIAGKCYIHAPFHPERPEFPYRLLIEPKMSFGTAHHETTILMIEEMLDMEYHGKRILDMGCGTGILAILAAKMGASEILAVDNDEWAFRNAAENCSRNEVKQVTVKQGDIQSAGTDYDIILANINRNTLLIHLPEYSKRMNKGELVMSGFYEEDLEAVRKIATINGFRLTNHRIKNKWTVVRFTK